MAGSMCSDLTTRSGWAAATADIAASRPPSSPRMTAKGDAAEHHEDESLEGVGPGGAAQAAVADVGHHHGADQQPPDPLRDLPLGDLVAASVPPPITPISR